MINEEKRAAEQQRKQNSRGRTAYSKEKEKKKRAADSSEEERRRRQRRRRSSSVPGVAGSQQVPIQVNKYLAYSDGMRVIESAKVSIQTSSSDGLLFTELDRPSGQPCIETKEFNLVRNMLIAAVEERYGDAAQWRDKLTQLRSKRNWI